MPARPAAPTQKELSLVFETPATSADEESAITSLLVGQKNLKTYISASGKSCALLTPAGSAWIACQDENRDWRLSRSPLAADALFGTKP